MFLRVDALKNICRSAKFEGMSVKKYNENMNYWFIYNSCAMEGNSYSLTDVMILLKDNVTIGGKTIREHNEIMNNQRVLEYMDKALNYKLEMDEYRLKDIHKVLTQNIIEGGFYRNCEILIRGRQHMPPVPEEAMIQIKSLLKGYKAKKEEMHPIELACYMYAEVERIYPFVEENGTTARIVLNYILLQHGYRPVIMKRDDKSDINMALDEYNKTKELKSLMKIIMEYEEEELKFYLQLRDEEHFKSFAS